MQLDWRVPLSGTSDDDDEEEEEEEDRYLRGNSDDFVAIGSAK